MTKIQKVACTGLCLCFIAVLFMMPGTFFPGKNIYRQLPLYCFLEEKASGEQEGRDQETYELLVENNGKYLGKLVEDENRKEEDRHKKAEEEKQAVTKAPAAKTTPAVTEEPWPSVQIQEDHQETKETSAEIKSAPVIDLAPETLENKDYLMNHFFVVDEGTSSDAVQLNAGLFLEEDFSLEKNKEVPQILIYHSHSKESFIDSREGKEEDTILGIGDYLTELLTEQYGYQVMHIKEAFDMKSGELDRSKAYDYAREYLEPLLEENPEIQVVIDLHRDGVSEDRHLVTEINGKPTAQILFYNGLSYTNRSGKLEYLPNPYIEDNLAFSFQLEYQAAEYYPEFYRGIYLAGYRYNLHMRPRSLLLEAGAQTNTVQEVKNAMEPFADILNRVLEEK